MIELTDEAEEWLDGRSLAEIDSGERIDIGTSSPGLYYDSDAGEWMVEPEGEDPEPLSEWKKRNMPDIQFDQQ